MSTEWVYCCHFSSFVLPIVEIKSAFMSLVFTYRCFVAAQLRRPMVPINKISSYRWLSLNGAMITGDFAQQNIPVDQFVVCRARHVFLRVRVMYHASDMLRKSQTQPGSGEGCSGITTGYPVTGLERQWPCCGRVPQTHGATNRNRLRRVWWDESATQDKVL